MKTLPEPTLMLVTDRQRVGGDDGLVNAVAKAVCGGVNVVQLREKDLNTQALVVLAGRLMTVTEGKALLVINGDAEAARETGALHLPEDADFVPKNGMLVGRSVHSVEVAKKAAAEGADYIVVGSVFESLSHPRGHQALLGLRVLSEVADAVDVPVIAIGGITAESVPDVMAAGASGVAVISAILGAESPEGAARALREALDGARSHTARDMPSPERA